MSLKAASGFKSKVKLDLSWEIAAAAVQKPVSCRKRSGMVIILLSAVLMTFSSQLYGYK